MTTDFNHGGQMIEYIQELRAKTKHHPDRLYLASYDSAPSSRTPFPFHLDAPKSPSKRARAQPATPSKRRSPVYFTIDDTLLYNAFHADFGPLHIGHLYRFAVLFHEILGDPANSDRPVVFYSKTDARSRANAACLVACYMVMIQSWPPHLALAPIAQADPPYMPFRDAGYSQADFILNIQDVVYGVWKAKEQSLCGLRDFNLEEYEKFERVDMGDFNWVTPDFLAFASPQQQPVAPIPVNTPEYNALPASISEISSSKLPMPFKNVLAHFHQRNVGLVVRLNSELYCPSYFTAMGIAHVDMIFEDGTCPPLQLVRRFIKMAHEMITIKKKGIAVHCKAGLGRTGCLIGAYLIYKYGFTANEVIAFMRFMRPGMVVGPQQHWLHLNQGAFREWWFEDSMREKLAQSTPVTPRVSTKKRTSNGVVSTPPNNSHSKRAALGEIDHNEAVAYPDQDLPAPTPGQPRKSHRKDSRHHPYSRTASGSLAVENEQRSHRSHRKSNESSESEEEIQLRRLAQRSSRSPVASPTSRSISYSATVTASYTLAEDNHKDQENWVDHSAPKTPVSRKSGAAPISVSKVRSSPRRATENNRTESRGVRKPSGRIGSNTISPARAIKTIH
ncbi:Tyrosine-protein phosphatase CDC14 [Penicillium expansum]|uniref:protein-tyrosine-phosphatase n=1 Tax=Penicillium expansum TaxID=27334 RepID=A0A0A2JZK8_PENEN|nr:Tyrosine-protein phosphatase CDC14 [Penicillium expansum]KGO44252.1 Tyrosine-protein phosphatase CDC14 [Penicillium expansum]KGO60078.1 Tyrosine-protein phosphatase CDC14 [Penicillium expansum]KGO64894.1 Tyrosine-protein phosphatase CDC14 [Penicillium expansum]